MKHTIKLKKYSDVINEYVAGGAITPGMLLKYDDEKKVVALNTTEAIAMFALEDELQGRGIDDNFAAGEPVQCWIPYRGDEVFALLTGNAVVAGDFVQSAGDGTLQKFKATLTKAKKDILCLGAAGFKLEADTAGLAGNAISITIVEGVVTAGSETVVVTGTDIVVTIEKAQSTIAQVVSALGGETDVTDIVDITAIGTQTGKCEAVAKTNLAGGQDASVLQLQIVGQVLEAVDPAGETVRVQVRIV
jgi:hypothetical protein